MANEDQEGYSDDPQGQVVDGSITTTLLNELRDGEVPPTDQHRLYTELVASEEPRAEYDETLETVQNEIQGHAEHLVSLETFLDEYGSAEEIIDQLHGDVETLTGDVEEILRELNDERSRKADRVRTQVEELKKVIRHEKDRLDEITGRASRINDSTRRLKEDIDGFEKQCSRRSDLNERTESLQDRVAELEAAYDTIVKFREQLLLAMNGDKSVNR